jgi:hypothetical protein
MISDATFQSFPTLIQLMIIRNGLGGIIIEQDGRHNVFGHSSPWYVAAVTLCCVLGLAMAYRVRAPYGPRKFDSIAVLPFTNLSGDLKQGYFVDGVTDTLTAELSKISSLQ